MSESHGIPSKSKDSATFLPTSNRHLKQAPQNRLLIPPLLIHILCFPDSFPALPDPHQTLYIPFPIPDEDCRGGGVARPLNIEHVPLEAGIPSDLSVDCEQRPTKRNYAVRKVLQIIHA